MTIKWLNDEINLRDKRVFCRVDFNVPMKNGAITDDTRIRAALPTIQYLIRKNAKVILASHLGRPKGKTVPELSLQPVAEKLSELLQQEVLFTEETAGDGVRLLSNNLRPGQVLVLENLRFHQGEEKNDEAFAKLLAQNADFYVNDAFGAAHRAHASVAAITQYFTVKMGGLLMKKEIEALDKLRKFPTHPYVAVLGGAKVSDKLQVLAQLLPRVDKIVIGGAMAYTFLKARNENIGASRFEEDRLQIAQTILQRAQQSGVEIVLPVDHVVTKRFEENAPSRVIASNDFEVDDMALDIGPKSRELFCSKIPDKGTVFWNGPMGVFEWAAFSHGTMAVMEAIASSHAFCVVGGGDSVAALNKGKMVSQVTHVSTGGGASLEFLEGAKLPGLEALGYEF